MDLLTAFIYLQALIAAGVVFLVGLAVGIPAAITAGRAERNGRKARASRRLWALGEGISVLGTPAAIITGMIVAHVVAGGPGWAPWAFGAAGLVAFALAVLAFNR